MGAKGKRNFTSTFDSLNAIHIESGRYGIWKGVSIAFASIIPQTAIILPLYDIGSNYLSHDSIIHKIGLASLIGMFAGIVTYPLDSFRRSYIAAGAPDHFTLNKSMSEFWTQTQKLGGMKILYRGLPLHLIRTIPMAYLQMSIFEVLSSCVPYDFK